MVNIELRLLWDAKTKHWRVVDQTGDYAEATSLDNLGDAVMHVMHCIGRDTARYFPNRFDSADQD